MNLELRARAAAAILELAFNPHQRRDSRGRWAKMPDSELKRPRRAARKAAPRRVSASEWLDEAATGRLSAATENQIKEAFAFSDPGTGMTATVSSVAGGPGVRRVGAPGPGAAPTGRVEVVVDIKDSSGLTVGKAVRAISPSETAGGKPQVYHTSFNLGKRAQGGGFSSRWLRQMEQQYRDAGIGSIGLTTTDVGGYAWAKAGFDFANRTEAKVAATALSRKLNSREGQRGLPQRVITDGLELVRRARTGGEDWPAPAEFAMLGWTPGAESWVGKEAMLGTAWHGKKEL
jgi:hypothetical protein